MARPKGIPSEFKGISYEEQYGIDRADEIKKQQSLKKIGHIPWNKGKKGVMPPPWNKGLTKETDKRIASITKKLSKRYKGKTYEEIHGIEKAKEIKEKQSENNAKYWSGKNHTKESITKIRRATIKQLSEGRMPNKETSIERLIENHLLFKEILYVKQHPYELGVADFWLPEDNIIIEADGDYWHALPKMVERDKRQMKWLEENDFVIYRFKESEIKETNGECVERALQ